ncbi:hypothetical protein DL98DRAFT_607057 [Cadophora sp. DSE1049]|nr:hypothetical protein DL98DRAFT_607057 [Cadophora sp. DSE1049]
MFALEKQRFEDSVEKTRKDSTRWCQKEAYRTAVTKLLVPITFFGLACVILEFVSRGAATADDFVFFIQYWDSLIYPITNLSTQYRWIMTNVVDAERLLFLLQTKPSITDKEDATDLGTVIGRVELQECQFFL